MTVTPGRTHVVGAIRGGHLLAAEWADVMMMKCIRSMNLTTLRQDVPRIRIVIHNRALVVSMEALPLVLAAEEAVL